MVGSLKPLARLYRTRLRRDSDAAPASVRAAHPIQWGNLRRLDPIDPVWGYGRGTPVDRWQLTRFFDQHKLDIRGRVLEVATPLYASEHGDRITRIDILDIDPENREATIIADLDDAGSLPEAAFDCVICTQTLQYVLNLEVALANLWQGLAPGGVLLLSVPALAKRDPNPALVDRWRLMPGGLATLVERVCARSEYEVVGVGNTLVVLAALLGIAAEDIDDDELAANRDQFPTLSLARVRKPYELAWDATATTT